MSDFGNYRLEDIARNPERGVYDLADGLLPEMAHAMGYELSEVPTTETLQGFIGHIGPAKTLQDNFSLVQERLATQADATTIAADWVDRSGSLLTLGRSFRGRLVASAQPLLPRRLDSAVFNTAVGRWQERRARKLIDLAEQGKKVGRVIILAGNRTMGENEHPEVAKMANADGELPTEARFAAAYIADMLKANDVAPVHVVPVESSVGDEIFKQGISLRGHLLNDAVLAVGNAPATIQVAGQFRKAARSIKPGFDDAGLQLFMAGDTIEVARHGESPATHQNPFTALGQIARNALVLHQEAQSLREQ